MAAAVGFLEDLRTQRLEFQNKLLLAKTLTELRQWLWAVLQLEDLKAGGQAAFRVVVCMWLLPKLWTVMMQQLQAF